MKLSHLVLGSSLALTSVFAADASVKDDKHCFVPFVKYRDHKTETQRSQSLLIGAGYHYVQKEGYNVKIETTVINPQSKINQSFSFENSYKFPINQETRLFPILGTSCDTYGLETATLEKKHYTIKTRFLGGAGVERNINGKFLLGLSGVLFRDMSDTEVKETDLAFSGLKFPKSNGYLVKASVDFKMDEKIFIRLEPFYRGTFKDIYTEKGASFSMICNF